MILSSAHTRYTILIVTTASLVQYLVRLFQRKVCIIVFIIFLSFSRVKLHSSESNLTIQDVVHEVVADHFQGADPQEKDPTLVPTVHVGLIHQRNQSHPQDRQRRGNQSLQGVPDPVLVPVHRHKLFAVMYYLCCITTKKRLSL